MAMSLSASVRSMLLIIVGVCCLSTLHAQDDQLPEAIKKELTRIETRLANIEGRIATGDPDQSKQSIKEARLLIDEFALNAELTKDDPLLQRLLKRATTLEDLVAKVVEERAEAAAKKPGKAMKKATEGPDLNKLVESAVDMNNISFKRDVAPIIVTACVRCHGGNNKQGDFDASTYEKFVAQIKPGDPANSHILKLVKGEAEPRMPRGNQAAFPQRWVDIWSNWIKQGAKFDGTSKTAAMASYMIDLDQQRRDAVARLSEPELLKLRQSQSERNLRIVNPKKSVETTLTKHFIVQTTLGKEDAEYAATLAEAVVEELTTRLKLSGKTQLFRGKIGLNIFADRYDFIAFARLVEGRAAEQDETSFVNFAFDRQYAVITTDGLGLDHAVADGVTRAVIAQVGQGKVAPWLVHGYAHAVGASFAQKASGGKGEANPAGQLVAKGRNLTGLFQEQYPWVELAPLSVSFFQYAMKTDKRKADEFIAAALKGTNPREASQSVFQASPDQLQRGWVTWVTSNSRGK